jgi:hypothetical protein
VAFYRALTFNPASNLVPSTQTNFPVTFIGTFSYLATVANGGKVQNASGFDIYFSSDSGGNTVIPFERVFWNPVTGNCEFWIQIASLGTGTTVIYLQYGNSAITTDQSNPTGTWDSNYVAVYHFGDGTTLNVNDSTGNANNGTNHSGTAVNTGIGSNDANFFGASGLGGSLALSSLNLAYVDLGTNSSLNVSNLTIEYWAKSVSSVSTIEFIVSNLSGNLTPNGNGFLMALNTSTGDHLLDLLNAGTQTTCSGRTVTVTIWQNYVSTYNGSASNFYTDASLDATTTAGSQIGSSGNNTFIGKDPRTGGSSLFDGYIDELRISKIARSADYVTTNYNMQQKPSNFVSIGSEQTSASPINENLSDTFSFGDTVAEFMQLGFAFADSNASNWGDAVLFNLQIPGIAFTENQAGNWNDAVLLEMDYDCAFSDQIILNDFQQPASSMDAFNDQLLLIDLTAIQVEVSLGFADTFSWTDSTTAQASILITKSDTFTFSDLFQFNSPLNQSFSDFFIWRDQQVVAWSSVLPPFSDTLTLSDSITVSNVPFWTPVNKVFADNFTWSDGIIFNLSDTFAPSDTFSFSDSITAAVVFNPFNQSFGDQFQFSDGVLIIGEGDLLQFADQLTLSDSVLVGNATSFNSYIRRYLNDEPA